MPSFDLRHQAHRLLNQSPITAKYFARRRQQRTADFYGELFSPGDLVFDIGANVGDRAASFRDLGARVIAVEPENGCVRKLDERFRDEELVTVVGKGCGARAEIGEIMVSATDSERSTMSVEMKEKLDVWEDQEWAESQQIEVTTLDLLIDEHGMPAFCKIDVENFEREVLSGLSQPLPALSFEFHKVFPEKVEQCLEILGRLGDFSVAASRGESMRLDPEWGDSASVLRWIDEHPDPVLWGDVYVRFTSD